MGIMLKCARMTQSALSRAFSPINSLDSARSSRPTNSSAQVTQKPDTQIRARVTFLLRICNPSRVYNPAKWLADFTDFGAAFAGLSGAGSGRRSRFLGRPEYVVPAQPAGQPSDAH